MDADLDTLATGLYMTTDDLLAAHPWCPAPSGRRDRAGSAMLRF